jgi:hypothetical protein
MRNGQSRIPKKLNTKSAEFFNTTLRPSFFVDKHADAPDLVREPTQREIDSALDVSF